MNRVTSCMCATILPSLESWENLGTASGALEANLVVGQRHTLENLQEHLKAWVSSLAS